MNKVILMGRLTRDPEVRYSSGENALAIARYTLAVDRRFRIDNEASADFIGCVASGLDSTCDYDFGSLSQILFRKFSAFPKRNTTYKVRRAIL